MSSMLLPDTTRPGISFGASCKMRQTLDDTRKTGRVMLELSNSAGKFLKALEGYGLYQHNYKSNPQLVGKALIGLVEKWHRDVSIEYGGHVDLANSFYLALSWNRSEQYQLFKFPLSLPGPEILQWDFPTVEGNGEARTGRRLRGKDSAGVLFEWYGESGGQLKYYPQVEDALWKSEIFQLEPLLQDNAAYYGILAKAQAYFPGRWAVLSSSESI